MRSVGGFPETGSVSYVNLHNHSSYSLLDGLSPVKDIVKLSKDFNCPAVAITDHGNLHAVPEFFDAAKKLDQKPIFGCEFYVAPEAGLKLNYYHLVLLAMNIEGYRNLCALTTLSSSQAMPDGRDPVVNVFGRLIPRICWEWLEQHRAGLICTSACVSSELSRRAIDFSKAPSDEGLKQYLAVMKKHKDIFGDNFYAEVMHDDMGGEIGDSQRVANEMVHQWAPSMGVKIVGTCDSHYLIPADKRNHQTLLDLSAHQKFYDPEELKRMVYKGRFWFKDPMEYLLEFGSEIAANTREIAAKVEKYDIHVKKFVLPAVRTVGEFKTSDATVAYKTLHTKAMEAFNLFVMSGRIPHEYDDPRYFERLQYELSVFEKMNMSQYPLALLEIVDYARAAGIPVGPGRGSVSGSLLCYVLGLHQVDPIKYGLYFERFLNPDRVSMPDIDTDFGIFGRPAVIDFIRKNWGHDHVSLICTFNTYGLRRAVHEVCKIMDLPFSTSAAITKAIKEDDIEATWDSAMENYVEFRAEIKKLEPVMQKDLEQAVKAIFGRPANLGVHAAGVLISSVPIQNVAPLIRAKDGVAVQYSFDHCESFGLLKMDILGNRNLDAVYNTCKLLGIADPTTIPLDDQKTYDLLCQGRLNGIFQIEKSRQFKEVCIRLQPQAFDEIVDLVALYRPGPIENGDLERYVKRKTDSTYEMDDTIADPLYRQILDKTRSCLIYQEQIMEVAKQLAGYSMAKADSLRSAIGKKDKEKLALHEPTIVAGLEKYGFSHEDAVKIWGMIVTSGRYSWNKAHAVAYGMITYWTAWLSANHPGGFFSTYCNMDIDQDKQRVYIAEARSRGAKVSGPNINYSAQGYGFKDGVVFYGIQAVRNVGENAVKAIIEERTVRGPFLSLADFRRRIPPKLCNKSAVHSLVEAGAFDCIYGIVQRQDLGQSVTNEVYDFVPNPKPKPTDLEYIRDAESKSLGFSVTFDPLAQYEEEIKAEDANTITGALGDRDEANEWGTDLGEVKLAGVITNLRKTTTKKKDPMAFGTLMDSNFDLLDFVIFPKQYAQVATWIDKNKPIIVRGELEDKQGMGSGTSNLKVTGIFPLGTRTPRVVQFQISDVFQAVWYNGLFKVKTPGAVEARATFTVGGLHDMVPEATRYVPVLPSYPNFKTGEFKHLY